MHSPIRQFARTALALSFAIFLPAAQAQTYEPVHVFPSSGEKSMSSLVKDDNGDFLGTTLQGGANGFGTIFKLTSAGAFSTLVDLIFPGPILPSGPLTRGSDGKFYGVTYQGGSRSAGTVYRVSSGGTLEKLATFLGGESGGFPQGRVAQAPDGSFFGVAAGGNLQKGVIFKVTSAKVLSIVANFNGATLGQIPNENPYSTPSFASGLIKGPDGNFYGVTPLGGSNGVGTVFKVTPAGKLSLVATFGSALPGTPYGSLLVGQDGNFYGTTALGGSNGAGTVFRLTPSTGVISVLASFDTTSGVSPFGELIQDAGGILYGTTRTGGMNGFGTVFKVTLNGATGTIAKIVDCDSTNGGNPTAGLAFADSDSLLGTATAGGAQLTGTIFKVSSGGALTKVTDFGCPDGINLSGGVTAAQDGALYGTTFFSGANVLGTFFKLNPANDFTKLGDFQLTRASEARLTLGSDGKLYGTLKSNSANYGTLYSATTAGSFTKLADFHYVDGSEPNGVIIASDGVFYGTTAAGGSAGKGVVYSYTDADGLKDLVDFTGPNGASPTSQLVEGSDGALYGTAPQGGKANLGVVFRVTKDGTMKVLTSFLGTNGSHPAGSLAVGADRNLYGATFDGGTLNSGVIFKITKTGQLTVLTNLTSVTGGFVTGGLILGPGGNFYGLAQAGGGARKYGTIFKVTPAGVVSVLKAFSGGADGSYPRSTLSVGPEGDLYGTTYNTVFRLVTHNQAPVATDDTLVLPAIHVNVLKNDTDANHDPLRILSVTQGAHGTVVINANGTLTYTPALDFTGSDTFMYTVTDPVGGTDTATVTVSLPSNVILAGLGAYTGVLVANGKTRGYCGVAILPAGFFSGAVYIDGIKTPLKGQFDASGMFQKTLARPNGLSSLMLTLTLDPGRNQVTGSISDGTDTFPVTLVRTFPSFTATQPTARAGRYTVLFPTAVADQGSAMVPQGTGYGSLTISPTGAVALAGRLGDGTPLLAGSRITQNDAFPLFARLYAAKGYLAGLVTMASKPESDAEGIFTWTKPMTGVLYPAGFSTNPTLVGARYVASRPVLSLPTPPNNAKLVFNNLGLTKTLTIPKSNVITVTNPAADHTAIVLTATTGVFNGTRLDGTTIRAFGGAIFQKGTQPRGEGFYRASTATDRVTLSTP